MSCCRASGCVRWAAESSRNLVTAGGACADPANGDACMTRHRAAGQASESERECPAQSRGCLEGAEEREKRAQDEPQRSNSDKFVGQTPALPAALRPKALVYRLLTPRAATHVERRCTAARTRTAQTANAQRARPQKSAFTCQAYGNRMYSQHCKEQL